MGVGAAESERTDAGNTRSRASGPGRQLTTDLDGDGLPGDVLVGGLAVQTGRELAVLQGQDDFDDTGNACGGLQMADIGLHGTDAQGVCSVLEDQAQGAHFYGVTQSGASAVRFNIV